VRRLAVALLALALIAGCSSKAERLYRRAEAFLAQGQFEMAAEEYLRLAREYERSPLADDAIYKLAYIYAEEMEEPTVALVQYRALADNYPSSPYADDALMRIMTIQREVLKDPQAVERTCEELCLRYEDAPALCARGRLEVARAWFEAGEFEKAMKAATELMASFPRQRRECANAALLMARAASGMGREQTEVEKLYERVIEQYPDTHAAAMAKRSIGLIYWGHREQQQQERAEEMRRRSRVIEGVPPHAAQSGEVLQALSAMRAALAHRGVTLSLEEMIALSGAAFETVFDPKRPELGQRVMDRSPFEVLADQLGFAHNIWSGPTAEQAFETAHQALLQGYPVLIRLGSSPRWVLLTGYIMAEDRVLYLPPGRDSHVASSREQFLDAWRAGSAGGSGVAGQQPFHQFSLGARLREPERADVLRSAIRRAATVMRLQTIVHVPAGTGAWEAVGRHLEACMAPESEALREQAVTWAERGLAAHLRRAAAGTEMLREASEVLDGVGDAAARHEELVTEEQLLATKINAAANAPESEDPEIVWQAAAAQANYVAALHARLAEQLADIADG